MLGAIVGAAALYLILSGKASGWTGGLGQNGWGSGNFGEYNMVSALVFEVVGTFCSSFASSASPIRSRRPASPASRSA